MPLPVAATGWGNGGGQSGQCKVYSNDSLVSYLSECRKHGISIIGCYGKIGLAEFAGFDQKLPHARRSKYPSRMTADRPFRSSVELVLGAHAPLVDARAARPLALEAAVSSCKADPAGCLALVSVPARNQPAGRPFLRGSIVE